MKRIIAALIACILVLGLFACGKKEEPQQSKDLLEQIKDRGYIIIATEGDWAPWTFHGDDDELTGFDVELGKLIAKGLGVEARFEETPWDSPHSFIEHYTFIFINLINNHYLCV